MTATTACGRSFGTTLLLKRYDEVFPITHQFGNGNHITLATFLSTFRGLSPRRQNIENKISLSILNIKCTGHFVYYSACENSCFMYFVCKIRRAKLTLLYVPYKSKMDSSYVCGAEEERQKDTNVSKR